MVTENYNFLPDEAKEIRIKVFVEEQGFKQEFDELDSICTHLVTFDNDKPCATVRFYEQNSVYYIGRLAVLKEYRSKHLGAKIVNEAERLIKAKESGFIRRCRQCRFIKSRDISHSVSRTLTKIAHTNG